MSKKAPPMEWNALYYNYNANQMEPHNVLRGREDFIRKMKKKFPAKEDFAKELRSEMQYRYWSKAEWEIVLTPLVGSRENADRKIDVFDQLLLNWDKFVDYCWNAV